MPERVHVVVRIRPFIASDPPDAELNTLVLNPTHVSVGDNRVFKVDRAYMMEDATELIYAESVAPLIRRFLRGFNASVLAYGQTGTGKTFTVQSLLPLLLKDIMSDAGVRRAAAAPPNSGMPTSSATTSPVLYLQYVEVYGETIRDLLEDSGATVSRRDGEEPGRIRLVTTAPGARAASPPAPDADRQVHLMSEREAATLPRTGCALVGAAIAPIFTFAQAAELIALGDARRATGRTNVHQYSSRSHSILTLFHPHYACRLDVVDLAGSERERKTGNVGVRFQESIAINTGLLALGNVMRALSRIHRATNGKDTVRGGSGGHTRTQHVPYRSSRLTRLLQDTLGGASVTVFIACVAPDTYNRDETLRTLQYCSLALRVLNEPLQQYKRLQRAQSPLCRRGSPSAAAVSPLSLREGPHVDAAGLKAYRESDEADDPTKIQLKVLELQSAYAGLQQHYDEQAEVIASMSASYATAKERLALCERELRKDESIFTQQIRAMQELVCENQKLRRRLAKASTTTTAGQAIMDGKAAMAHDPPVCGSANPHQLARSTKNSRRDGEECTEAIRDMLLAGARDAADGVGISPQLAPSYLQGHHQQHSAPAAATAATRPPMSAHSPHCPHSFTDGAQCLPFEEVPLALTHQAGVRVHDGGRGAEAPTYSSAGNCTKTLHALHGATLAAAASEPASVEPAQSFIRYILGLHGIHPEAEQADSVEDDYRRGTETAAPSPQSSIHKSVAVSAGGVALQRAQALEPMKESNADDHARLAGAPPLPGGALSRRSDRSITSSPLRAVHEASEDDRRGWERQVDRQASDTDAVQLDNSVVLLLATEVLRHQGTSAALRNQVQVLQAELDKKQKKQITGAMKVAAPQARAPRPPLSALSDPNSTATQRDGAAAVAAMPETHVRRRLAQIETQLRDMDEEARRVRALQEQEIENLERDNMKLREQLELIRMEECMSLGEARALQEHTNHHRTAGAPAGLTELKLVGSATLKYRNAKAEVQKLRRECAQAERLLEEAQAQLIDVRNRRKEVKQRSRTSEMSAAVRIAEADNYRTLIHERLRSLEEQLAREQECFNHLVTEAKQVRVEVDTLLVNQTSNENIYRRRYDALLTKRREMAYLMEVCNVLCEERQHVVAQLTQLQARMAEENRQYEVAFDELTGVQSESAKAKATKREQLEELRRTILQTRIERESLEEDNRCAKVAIQGQRRRTVRRRLNDEASAENTRQASLGCTTLGEESGVSAAGGAGVVDGDGSEGLWTPESVLPLDGSQQQIRMYEGYYRKLSSIVQSDAIEDVAGFMDAAAEERYKSFDEMHTIKRDMAALEGGKAALMAQLNGGGGASAATSFFGAGGPEASTNASETQQQQPSTPISSLAALASADTLEDLAAVTASVATAKSRCPSASGASTDDKQERAARMASLLNDLGATRGLVCEEEEEQEASAAVLAQVVALVSEVFRGLGCSTDELRALTGMEGVQQSTLLQCIAMIEQRASEYLIAYSLQQQRLLSQTSGVWSEAQAKAAVTASSTRSAAHTLLRRPDLQPRAAKNSVAAAVVSQALPRSTDVMAGMPTTEALAASNNASIEDLAVERPLSKADLREIVKSKRAMLRR